jgi:hypothetical protein
MKRWLLGIVLVLVGLGAVYGFVVSKWSYSDGERAGWIQKFSRKGWVCKTWEGEMAMVTMPGTLPEKFDFTVRDDAIVSQIQASMGHRVSLTYEQKKGLPSNCFGDTEYWVVGVRVLPEAPGMPGAALPPPEPAPSPAPQGAAPALPQVAPPVPPKAAPAGGAPASPY